MKKYWTIRLWNDRLSYMIDRSLAMKTFLLLAICMVVFLGSIALGDIKLSPVQLFEVFLGNGSKLNELVVFQFRMPRIIVSLMVGIALAIAGAILQGMVRNPLASPDIIGITGGASVGVVAFLAIFSDANNVLTVSIQWMPVAAFLGATVTAFLVYILAWRKGVSPIRLVLIGIGISALMQAMTTMFMLLGPIYQASQANVWITGTVNGSRWGDVQVLVPWVVVLSILAFVMSRHLNIQELGDDLTKAVGERLQTRRLLFLLLATGLVGSAVAFAGGIGFVGLMAPHMARRLVGSSYGVLIPASALLGGLLVMLADLIGRTFFLPLEVPAGVFTAAIGAPYFIYLLFRTRNA